MSTISEIETDIYRINTPVTPPGLGGFSFNQYLIVDDAPLLFHTGPRKLFAEISEAVARIIPLQSLRFIGLSHFEGDECGSLNEFLAVATDAAPVCGQIAAMTSVGDVSDRAPHVLGDGETLTLGRHNLHWIDTPHLPHAWECGFLMETQTATLLCGDLFTQGGADNPALTEADILGPSEAFRRSLDYFSHAKNSRSMLERLAALNPRTLACMHGSAWRGDGASLLRGLADSLEED
ncbi:MAG: MBL fold metallo-hydrolase [Alphaproteobacteria bacterium]|nr:MBL fold metallo-hydrolase [Alphaproteobacteria bacterium]